MSNMSQSSPQNNNNNNNDKNNSYNSSNNNNKSNEWHTQELQSIILINQLLVQAYMLIAKEQAHIYIQKKKRTKSSNV